MNDKQVAKISENVLALVVTYYPKINVLRDVLTSLKKQVENVVIIDNGSNITFNYLFFDKIETIMLKKNYGIAKAQNIGINYAIKNNWKYVLLMDQDSIAAPGMIMHLVGAAEKFPNGASFGPCYIDQRQKNSPPFIKITGLHIKRYLCQDENKIVPVDYLISSGSLIPLKIIKTIGGMREDLFIDYVDIEWGLRAKSFGYQNYGVCDAKMWHTLGDKPVTFWGRKIPMHSPERHYYHFRNAVLLYKQKWVPLNWKIVDGLRLLRKFIFYAIFTMPRFKHFYMITLGLFHGIIGRSGELEKKENIS